MFAALVGRLGAAELGAVGLSSLIFNLSNFLFNFLLIVTTPKIAAAVARSDTETVCVHHPSFSAVSECNTGIVYECFYLSCCLCAGMVASFCPSLQMKLRQLRAQQLCVLAFSCHVIWVHAQIPDQADCMNEPGLLHLQIEHRHLPDDVLAVLQASCALNPELAAPKTNSPMAGLYLRL